MKIMFISDIHGIKTNLKLIEEEYKKLKCDKLVVLGDLYYIGPRNKMNEDYDIQSVIDFLNSHKEEIICIKGNCDADVDQVVSDFPIIKEGVIETDGLSIYLTHGDYHNENNWNKTNSVLVYGHFHIPFIKEKDTNIFINPGSISLPKENNNASFMIYENRCFEIYDILGNKIFEKRGIFLEK